MPAMAGTPTTVASLGFSFMDIAGKPGKASITNLASAPSGGAVTNMANALGNASNAALVSVSGKAETYDDPTARVAFDEGYASCVTKATFIFQNAARRTKRLELPAPDASIFASDGETVDYTNALVVDIVAKYQVIVGSSYVLKSGFLNSRTRKTTTSNRPPTVREPDTLELPGGGPGLEP